MTLYSPLMLEAVTGDTGITYHAQDFRGIISALAPNEGVINAGDLAVSQRGAGANMSVDVAAGRAVIQGDSIANQGTYIVRSDAAYNVPITAANATNPRIDLIVATVKDKQADGGSTYGWILQAIAGTPAASPVAPGLPVSSIPLAQVYVRANATSILTTDTGASTVGYITDKRTLAGVGDVPKWEMIGTTSTAQVVPNTSQPLYTPGSVTQLVGVTQPNASQGSVTIRTPGRYAVSFCARLGSSAALCNRTVTLGVGRAAGGSREIGNGAYLSAPIPLAVSATIYLNAGDTVGAYLFQDSSGPVSVDESRLDAAFSGVWVGA